MEYPKIQVPDAHVYKLHILNARNEVSHVVVFNRERPYANEDVLYENIPNLADDAQLIYSKQQLLPDDPIRVIKKKMLMDITINTDLQVSYEELYLFAYMKNTRSAHTLFDELLLAQQRQQPDIVNKTELLHTTLVQTFGNTAFPTNVVRTQYTADEFELLVSSSTQTLYLCSPIGPKSSSFEFHADPYTTPIVPAFVEYLENTLLMNAGSPRDNILYLCMAEPLLQFHGETGALIDMYFKLLNPYYVRTLPDLMRVRPTLMKKTQALLHPDVFALYDSVQLMHDVYYSRTADTVYAQHGIQSFQLQLHPDFQNTLPLEVIFKSIHATKLVPFIKYNPGERRENIYRIYFEKLSKNGKKVPYLKDRMIVKLSREMGRSGQISLYIQQPFVETATALYLHFELSGRVTIQCELKRPLMKPEIDALLNEAVNPVINSINQFLEQTGFYIPKYTSMDAGNISVEKVRYVMKTKITNRIVLRNVGCIYSAFNVFRDNAEDGTATMRFKRVDNYQEMDAKTIFISENRDNIPVAIEGLMLNFTMTADDAKLEIARFFDTHSDMLGNIVDNPGFPVTMRLEKTLEATHVVFEVEQINNLNYLDTIFVYLDSLIRITQNIRGSAFSRDTIGRICKNATSKKTQDVSHIKNVVVSTSTGVGAVSQMPVPVPKKSMFDFDLLKELEIDADNRDVPLMDDVDIQEDDTQQAPATEILDGVFFDDDDDFDGEAVSENEIHALMLNTDKYNDKTPKSLDLENENENEENEVVKETVGPTTVLPKSLFSSNSPNSPKSIVSEKETDVNDVSPKSSSPEGVFFEEEDEDDENNVSPKYFVSEKERGDVNVSPTSSSPEGVFFDEEEEDNVNTVSPKSTVPEKKDDVNDVNVSPKSSSPEGVFFEEEEEEGENETNDVNVSPKSSSPEGVFFDEDELEMEDMEGGNEDDMFDDDIDDNTALKNDPSGMSLNNPNPFLQRLTSREPELYLTSKQGKYKAYSTNCQPINRQPVILTDTEKRKIDTEHPGSYHHAIKYGTDPNNKFWYICPRYWCFLTNTSMTKEEVDSGKCGNIIPDNANTIPKGAYVYEFKTEDHFDEKGNYIDHYPGFGLKEDAHPKGHCLPCCFKNWNKGKQKERKEQCLGTSLDGPDASYTSSLTPATAPATAPAPPLQKRQNVYVISFDTYPIPETRWGFLPISAQMYVGTNYAQSVDKNNNALILPNKPVMLRYGVEQLKNQSFLGVFANVYAHTQKQDTTPRVSEFKQQLIQALTLDVFLKLHNGSLVSSFRSSSNTVDLYKYRNTQFYQKYPPTTDENKQVLLSTVGSYEQFLAYLKDNTQPIDHTYLWDLFCFTTKLNLILLEVRNNDVTDKIELVCPTNMYSNTTFDPRRDSVIVLKHDEFYEPVYQYRIVNGVVEVQKTVSENTINPTLKQLLLNIKYTSKKYCSPLPSVPKVYKFRPPILVDELLQHIRAVSCVAKAQVVNYQGQVIGVVTSVLNEWTQDIGAVDSDNNSIPNHALTRPQTIPTVAPVGATVVNAETVQSPVGATVNEPNTEPIKWLQFHDKAKELKKHVLPPNALRELITFSSHSVVYDDVEYPTVEHAYQAQKYTCTANPELAIELFSSATTTFETMNDVKNAGDKKEMKKHKVTLDSPCWDAKKEAVMEALIASKIERHPTIQKIMELAKQHHIRFVYFSRSDKEWGAQMNDDGTLKEGLNKLGEIYNRYIARLPTPANANRTARVGGAEVVENAGYTIMLPCYPSAPRDDMPMVEMDEPAIWKSYEYSRELLTKLSKTSQLKIPCRPVIKVVDDGMIVGVITETYQFVQINPPQENVVMDNLHTLNNANFNTVDRVLATKRNPDKERVSVIKNIQLETAFYSLFRSTLRKLIASQSNIRGELIVTIENKTMLYRQKVEAVSAILKKLGRGRIQFEDIDRDVLMELNDITDCNPEAETSAYCIVRDDGTPQLLLPKLHLLSGKQNELVYYTRLADELLRYDRVKMFMFQPQMYLNIRQSDYQVATDEFILIHSALTSGYFDDLDVLNENARITNVSYQFARPANTQTYANQLISLGDQQFIDVLAPTEGAEALCIKSASIPIVGNTMSMWVRSFPRQAREIVFQNTPTCSFHVMMTILNDKFGKMVDVRAIKELLWGGYIKLMDRYQTKVVEILRNQGKLRLMMPVLNNRVTFETLLFSEHYYLSDLDIWVLATTYNLPVILFTSTFLKGVQGKINWLKLGGGVGDKYYFVRSTITSERDNVAEYHLVKPALQLNELGEFSAQYQSALQGSQEHAKHVRSLVQMLESVEFIKAPKAPRGK